jgi:hypothetical protein
LSPVPLVVTVVAIFRFGTCWVVSSACKALLGKEVDEDEEEEEEEEEEEDDVWYISGVDVKGASLVLIELDWDIESNEIFILFLSAVGVVISVAS